MRERLLAALRDRIQHRLGTGENDRIADPAGPDEAAAALGHLAAPDGLDWEVLHTLGLWHWLRAVTLPPEQTEQDRALAVPFLVPFYLRRPDSLPEPVRSALADLRNSAEPVTQAEFAESVAVLARFLLGRFAESGGTHRRDGESAIRVLADVLDDVPEDRPSWPVLACDHAYARLLVRVLPTAGDEQPDQAELDAIIAAFRRAFAATPQDHPNYSRCANGLGCGLRLKAAATRDPALLAEAVQLARTAAGTAADTGEHPPNMPADLDALLLKLLPRTRDGAGEQEDHPLAAVLRILGIAPNSGDSRDARTMDLVATVLRYPAEAGIEEVLAKVLELGGRQVEHLPPGQRLAALHRFFEQGAQEPPQAFAPVELSELNEVAELHDRLLARLPEDDPDRGPVELTRLLLSMARVQFAPSGSIERRQEEMIRLVEGPWRRWRRCPVSRTPVRSSSRWWRLVTPCCRRSRSWARWSGQRDGTAPN
ncbi:hypothetical protein [Amycolatopsis aidingensis]|uniref:hypothetical protein n=1 Tax=Amycolatopsis aidingensis TaxID=2842453 RepID=UPI001E417E9E|nr:hypothetical protein [Amycolatopsis aidingensis]